MQVPLGSVNRPNEMHCFEKKTFPTCHKLYIQSISKSQEQPKELDYFEGNKVLVDMQYTLYTGQKESV